jgi:hypothetical protein
MREFRIALLGAWRRSLQGSTGLKDSVRGEVEKSKTYIPRTFTYTFSIWISLKQPFGTYIVLSATLIFSGIFLSRC